MGQLQLFEVEQPEPDWAELLPRFEKPKNENETLFNLQYSFRIEKNKNALVKINNLAQVIALKLINQETNRNKHLKSLSMDIREDKALNASLYLIQRYLADPSFYVSKSFVAYMYLRVKHELYYQRKVDLIVDFVDFSKFYKDNEDFFIFEQEFSK